MNEVGRAKMPHLLRQMLKPLTVSLLVIVAPLGAPAQELRITDIGVDDLGGFHVGFPASVESYYLLLHGDAVTDVSEPVVAGLGMVGTLTMNLPPPAAQLPAAQFFRLRQIPIAQPLDTDGDGIDDVWELRFRQSGAALDGADALQDHNGNGRPDLDDYRDEVLPLAAGFALAESAVLVTQSEVGVPVILTKPHSGRVRFQVGGTALPGRDYEIAGITPTQSTADVPVNGTSAVIPVRIKDGPIIERDRVLVLSLVDEATPTYRLSATAPLTHALRITEADRGVYFGTLSPTNGFVLAPQPLRIALRTKDAGIEACFDTTLSTLFQAPFTMPARLVNGTPVMDGVATGQLDAATLGRTVSWSLSFPESSTDESGVTTAGFQLILTGLSASGRPVTASGALSLNPLN